MLSNIYKRVIVIVTDGLGIGGDKRAKEFGDKGANTFLHVSETGLLEMPTWKKLGIDSIAKLTGFNKAIKQTAYMARMQALSNAKDTLAGHWEMMGNVTVDPFPVFTENGFPPELVTEFEKIFEGRKVVANKAVSGTVVIDEFWKEERDNNGIIVYTSADSNVQICGHEEWIGLDKLYEWCEKVRTLCSSKPEWNVGRIIARPYIGSEGKFVRTANRHDYAVKAPNSILNDLQAKGIKTIGLGKISDIFSGNGVDVSIKQKSDDEGMDNLIDLISKDTKDEFIFVNLVQFDSDFGHRRNPDGYAENINRFDIKLAKLINAMHKDDLLIITSDHGNDPTMPGSDHTREQVPVTIYSKSFKGKPKAIEEFVGFASIGNIVASNFGIETKKTGKQDFSEII